LTRGEKSFTFTCTSSDQRRLSFMRMLPKLEEAGKNGYEDLQSLCQELEATITTSYPSIPFADVAQLSHLTPDTYSKLLLPSDIEEMVPLKCVGDGNCLFR